MQIKIYVSYYIMPKVILFILIALFRVNEKRTFEVISSICTNNIKPTTTIYTSGWRSYIRLSQIGYQHIDFEKYNELRERPLSTTFSCVF